MPLSPPSSRANGLPLGLTGATAATRYVGATASGAPASGTFAVGDFCVDQTGKLYVCTAAGTPGTWAQIGGSIYTTVVAASDQSIASSIVLTNDAELSFATVAGKAYEIQALIIYGSPAGGGTPDMQTAWGEDATARGVANTVGFSNTDAAFAIQILANQTATAILGTAAADRAAYVTIPYVGNGGTFRLKWAQNVSGANPTIRRAGSLIRYAQLN